MSIENSRSIVCSITILYERVKKRFNYRFQERWNGYNISSTTLSAIYFFLTYSYQLLLYITSAVKCEVVIVEHLQPYYDYLPPLQTLGSAAVTI